MDTTPLPNREGDLSDSDSLSTGSLALDYYVIRVTSHGKFTFDELKAFIEKESQLCRYVIGRETVPQEHFHIVVGVDNSVTIQDVKDIIRAFIVPLWIQDGKLPKGFGNKQYNCQLSEDKVKAVSYALKGGEYVQEGFTDEFISMCLDASFEKKKPSNFKAEYQSLLEKFQETDMGIKDFMIEYCLLKAKYGQMVSTSDAYKYALSAAIRKDPELAEAVVEQFLDKQ